MATEGRLGMVLARYPLLVTAWMGMGASRVKMQKYTVAGRMAKSV